MNLRVNVIPKDIKLGIRCSFCNCPLAKAISRALNRPFHVGHETGFVYLGNAPGIEVSIPENAIEFRRAFDNKEQTYPFQFDLSLPDFLPPFQPNPKEWFRR